MTDTNQASELFELCKEVYELTGWDNTHSIILEMVTPGVKGSRRVRDWHNNGDFVIGEQDGAYPLYTSDYLLEKLPKTLERPNDAYGALWGKPNLTLLDDGFWEASYRYEDEMNYPDFCYVNEHLTPLKALLKLTIALSEAGELNDQSS